VIGDPGSANGWKTIATLTAWIAVRFYRRFARLASLSPGLRNPTRSAAFCRLAGIAAPNTGTPPDRSAWKRVLAEKRLIGETASDRIGHEQGRSRFDNPRSHVELLPELHRMKGY
jgi:hypothetical protein